MSTYARRPINRQQPMVVGTGGPNSLALDIWANFMRVAFPSWGVYLVGSATRTKQRRDVDVVCILADDEFEQFFGRPSSRRDSNNPRWVAMCLAFSMWASEWTDLPIDFKFQGQTMANERHGGRRLALGIFPVDDRPSG